MNFLPCTRSESSRDYSLPLEVRLTQRVRASGVMDGVGRHLSRGDKEGKGSGGVRSSVHELTGSSQSTSSPGPAPTRTLPDWAGLLSPLNEDFG